jgi:hypothetical protein
MNKMNLPPPFGPLVPPAIADENFFVNQQPPSSATEKTAKDTSKRKRDELLSSSESELDSEEEDAKRKRTKRPSLAATTTTTPTFSTIIHPPTTMGSGISIVISAAPGLTVMPQIDPSLLRNCVSLEALMSSRATQEGKSGVLGVQVRMTI